MSSYVNNQESPGELSRLIKQAGLFDACTGIVPHMLQERLFGSILDIGCGPGNWVIGAAHLYPDADIIGMDISKGMIRYAQMRADLFKLKRVSFEVRDALDEDSFPLEDEDYDLIHLGLASSWLPTQRHWQKLLRQCYAMLDPGGAMVVTEAELALTTSPALNRLQMLILSAFKASGRSTIPGNTFGVVPHLSGTFQHAGFEQVTIEVNAFDISYAHEMENVAWRDTIPILIYETKPFLIKHGVTTEQELAELEQVIQIEMYQEDFSGIIPLYTFIGRKEEGHE